jgi:hypothetical protein
MVLNMLHMILKNDFDHPVVGRKLTAKDSSGE